MDNNDVLIRVRYALEIKNKEMMNIFQLGGMNLSIDEVRKLLIKSKDSYHDEARSHSDEELEENIKCTNRTLETFLNGLITYKRGKQETTPGQPERPMFLIKDANNVNNIILKKLKVALSLTTDDILDIFDKGELYVSKGELSALLRKEGHKNYKECGDNFLRKFLKGLAVKYRG